MKKILICTRKNKGTQERELEMAAADIYKERGGSEVKVMRDEELSWRDLKAIHGNYKEATRAVGRQYDVVVLVEAIDGDDRTIGRGQFEIAKAALAKKNILAVARPGPPQRPVTIQRVQDIRIVNPNDWKTKYAEVLL